jgi:hemerythrin superfamily protein
MQLTPPRTQGPTVTQPQPGGAGETDSRDVVDLILDDHREMERLFRALRNRDENRQARLRELADLLVAHAEAEEREVYPVLKREAPQEREEIAHSYEEHDDGHEALASLQEVSDGDQETFEERLEELVETVTHHLDEEERDVLNAARENVDAETRKKLGDAFLQARNDLIAQQPGDPEKVRELIGASKSGDSSSQG